MDRIINNLNNKSVSLSDFSLILMVFIIIVQGLMVYSSNGFQI